MTWCDVRKYFPKRWVNKLNHLKPDLGVKAHLSPWLEFSKEGPVTLSKYVEKTNPDLSRSKRAALAKKRPASFANVKEKTKRSRRSDSGQPRKHVEVVAGVEEFIMGRWNSGDPWVSIHTTHPLIITY